MDSPALAHSHLHDDPAERLPLGEMFARSNTSVEHEYDQALELVEGAVPEGLRGVLLRNGPGRLKRFGTPYGHLFDGDGHVNRFAFTANGIHYRNRYVQTQEYQQETRAGRLLYRGFGTNLPGGLRANLFRTTFKNTANTSLVWHAGKLLALWEGGLPHRIDPMTLATLGRETNDETLLNHGSWLDRRIAHELPYSAHPRLRNGVLYNFGVAADSKPRLMLYRTDASGQHRKPTQVPLEGGYFIHDFVLTERFRVFFLTSATFDLPRTLLGIAPPAATLHSVPTPTEVLVLDREDPVVLARFRVRPCFIFHFTNGFELGDELVVDGFRMDEIPTLSSGFVAGPHTRFPTPILTRYTLKLSTGTVREQNLTAHAGELATIHPEFQGKPYRYVYAMGSPLGRRQPHSTGVLKIDCEQRATSFRELCPSLPGEPFFVPAPGGQNEDDGFVLVLTYADAVRKSELLVLSAKDLRTLCRARMPHSTPLGFHGTWLPEASLQT